MIEPERLAGRWVHSHEEDSGDELVFRSADSGFTFPPARGREVLDLNPDGSYGGTVPGPDDRPAPAGGGRWALEAGDRLVLPDRTLEVVDVDGGVLRVRRPR